MTAAAARTIWQLNQDPAQYSAYVPDTEAGITLALQESGVEAVALPANGLAVLDQYSEDNVWTVEVWGPFLPVPTQSAITTAVDAVMMHIKKRPAHVNFFFGQENSRVRASLAQYGARLSRHTIWQMQAIPATMIKKEIQHYTAPLPADQQQQVLQLHRQFFTGDAVTDVSVERPLWVAWQDAQPVGYALAEVDIDHVGHLLYVAVAPAAQHQGWGQALMAVVWQDMQISGVNSVILVQSQQNAQVAGAVYQRLGFKQLKTLIAATIQLA